MIDLSIWYRYSVCILAFSLSFNVYAIEKPEDTVFEKLKEAEVTVSSTFFITPREVKKNHRTYHRIDRSVTKMDRFTIAEKHNYNFQDLGNHWTAGQPIFYTLPQSIGANYGCTVYDFYFQNPQDIRYYQTAKAYAYFNVVLANLGSFVFDGCYTQKLNNHWHIGTNWHGTMTENEWPHTKDDKIVNAFPYFDIFTHIKTSCESYHLFTSWSNMSYITRETGGVRSSRSNTKGEKLDKFLFNELQPMKRYESSLPLLAEPYMKNKIDNEQGHSLVHKDLRRNFYLYHHYEFSQGFQVYHELNHIRKSNICTIQNLPKLINYISNESNVSTTSNSENNSVIMRSFGNEFGLKGDVNNANIFYSVYYRLEDIYWSYLFSKPKELLYSRPLSEQKLGKENYLGASTRWQFGRDRNLALDGEYLFEQQPYYKFQIAYEHNFFKVAYRAIRHKTPYIVAHGYSRHRLWEKDFTPPFAQQIDAEVWQKFPYVDLHPIVSFKNIHNHIFYKKAILPNQREQDNCVSEPVQANMPIWLLSLGGNLNFCFFSYYHFDNTVTFLKDLSQGLKIFQGYMPPYMYTGRYYYAHQPYGKKMDIETGLNIHYKELYYGDGYDVVAQQFYRQNKFAVQGRPIADIFFNVRINNLKLSIKYSYINEYFNKPQPYFVTPFYPGLKKAADIGIHWSFFD